MPSSFMPRRRLTSLFVLTLVAIGALPTMALAGTHPGQAELVREVARDTGQSPAALNALLDKAHKQQSILDAISRPAESKPWSAYRPIFLTGKRIDAGVAFYREHRAMLERVAKQYGVSPEIIVAILGVETSYGGNTGHYKVLDALVTLGLYYPPRAKFFRSELKTLLELPSNKLAGPIDTLTGSYAGAQGWGQFMPDSIRDYAVDADGDGRIDLHDSLPDILASVANYFAKHGWVRGGPVAAQAQPDAAAKKLDWQAAPQWSLEQLEAWGYAPLQRLNPGQSTSLLTLDGARGPEYWFTFQNFQVITRYNRSPLYAMAVYQLSQAIAAGVHADDMAGTATR
ncbi:lytic murein transglycosylase B [Rhodanobacter glycinis]|uniref:Membrane-bound lytic murein transglycosylase B n=1 Tax=Rhodanobacter glycinis TaxID=582702 RepID=A0A1I4D7A2_9GAMM|nr:lytic murein transglycosylase B [Rhodanobacter glycinis]SFK89458.1 membrane-bound lytic murein transglycosylase B [Rhodanobacter glycinis]